MPRDYLFQGLGKKVQANIKALNSRAKSAYKTDKNLDSIARAGAILDSRANPASNKSFRNRKRTIRKNLNKQVPSKMRNWWRVI